MKTDTFLFDHLAELWAPRREVDLFGFKQVSFMCNGVITFVFRSFSANTANAIQNSLIMTMTQTRIRKELKKCAKKVFTIGLVFIWGSMKRIQTKCSNISSKFGNGLICNFYFSKHNLYENNAVSFENYGIFQKYEAFLSKTIIRSEKYKNSHLRT
jgi:hypothetical protein